MCIRDRRTDALWNAVGEESKGYIYAFKIDLKDKVYLESGFVSVCAVDTGEKHQTYFCTIHDSSRSLQGLISMEQEGSDEIRWFAGGFNYCFLGSTDEPPVSYTHLTPTMWTTSSVPLTIIRS